MSWLLLLIAGLLEVVWAIGIKYTDGFTKLAPSIFTLGAMGISFYLLSVSLRALPLGTAYAVWVGIGATGTAIAGVLMFNEAVTLPKVFSLILVVVGIIGLKVSNTA